MTVLWMVGLLVAYAAIAFKDQGSVFASDTVLLNTESFLSFFGMAVYMFEGVGIILPVMDTCSCPEHYPKIVGLMILMLTTMYVLFSNFNYFVYGASRLVSPMITSDIP